MESSNPREDLEGKEQTMKSNLVAFFRSNSGYLMNADKEEDDKRSQIIEDGVYERLSAHLNSIMPNQSHSSFLKAKKLFKEAVEEYNKNPGHAPIIGNSLAATIYTRALEGMVRNASNPPKPEADIESTLVGIEKSIQERLSHVPFIRREGSGGNTH